MKPLFEEHEGQLFRMLEEPVPLAPDAEMPCLVRLIQDDSLMGRYNRDASYSDVIGKLWVAQKIKENPYYSNTLHAYYKDSNGQDSCIASIHQLEIIGYQVDEGSRWWALYQMMQGEKICHHKSPSIVYCKPADAIRRQVRYNCVDYMSASAWLNGADKNGWQIYKEPKIESPKEPDYVICKRCGGTGYDIKPEPAPKFVVVPINISGTVRQAYNEDGTIDDEQFQLLPNGSWDGTEMFISFDALDSHTRKLVESLLKAQEEEK